VTGQLELPQALLEGLEVDVDAVCDGERVLIPGLLEHVERAGVHSGDSIALLPPQQVGSADVELIIQVVWQSDYGQWRTTDPLRINECPGGP